MAGEWTKKSGPLSSVAMKPKPFSALNHLTVPCGIPVLPAACDANPAGTAPTGGCADAARRRSIPSPVESTVASPPRGPALHGRLAGDEEDTTATGGEPITRRSLPR